VSAALPFRVLVITDEDACARVGRGVMETVARALLPASPSVAVLVRTPHRSLDDVRSLCGALAPIARRAGASLLVHTHLTLVRELGLAGAHVRSGADVREARALLPAGALLGASRHDGDALDRDALAPLDYVTLSPIFSPLSKRDARAPLGVDALARACAAPRATPLVALGGIDRRNARACIRAGAPAVAVVGAVMSAHDPRRALSALCSETS
jgi:thiamine-phosphate pyrophosphorylase